MRRYFIIIRDQINQVIASIASSPALSLDEQRRAIRWTIWGTRVSMVFGLITIGLTIYIIKTSISIKSMNDLITSNNNQILQLTKLIKKNDTSLGYLKEQVIAMDSISMDLKSEVGILLRSEIRQKRNDENSIQVDSNNYQIARKKIRDTISHSTYHWMGNDPDKYMYGPLMQNKFEHLLVYLQNLVDNEVNNKFIKKNKKIDSVWKHIRNNLSEAQNEFIYNNTSFYFFKRAFLPIHDIDVNDLDALDLIDNEMNSRVPTKNQKKSNL